VLRIHDILVWIRIRRSIHLTTEEVLPTCSVPDPDPPDLRVFGLPDPDPLVRGMDPDPALDPDPDPSIIMQK
jgi:hypothetical protein